MKGIKLVTIGLISWLVFTVISILLWSSTFYMAKSMNDQGQIENLSMQYDTLASDLLESCDYLKDEARAFVETGDMKHLNNYLYQLGVARTREKTMDKLIKLGTASQETQLIERVKISSDQMVSVELRALRLVLAARGVAEHSMPGLIRAANLSSDESILAPNRKLEKARLLLFDATYEVNKEALAQSITDFRQEVRSKLLQERQSADTLNSDTLKLQTLLAIIVLIGIAAVLIIIYLEMTRPIEAYIKALDRDNAKNVSLVPMGTKEMRVLAETFNQRSSQLYAAQQELTKLATTDCLTESFNRRMFLELGEKEVKRAERYGYPLSVLMLDVDHFKKVNDGYGHQVGDRVLQFLVQKGLELLRPSDIFGRLGGEEFGIILPETDGETALRVAERLRGEYEKARILTDPGEEFGFTVSIGVVCRESGDLSIDNILKRADQALYLAKNSGRNRSVVGA